MGAGEVNIDTDELGDLQYQFAWWVVSECVFAPALSKVFFMFVVLLEQTRHSTRHVLSSVVVREISLLIKARQ
jgi:hypothetical protein